MARSLIFSIFLVLVLLVPNLNASEPDWPELQSYLDVTEEGLQMIEAPLSEIENLQSQREQASIEVEQDLTQREMRLEQKEKLSNERGLALNEREKDLDFQEILFNDMANDLGKANRKLESGWKWLFGSLVVGIVIGILTDRFVLAPIFKN